MLIFIYIKYHKPESYKFKNKRTKKYMDEFIIKFIIISVDYISVSYCKIITAIQRL